MEHKPAEYIFYAITRPTRVGRRMVFGEIFRTKSEAKESFTGWWELKADGEREWRRRQRRDGWKIETVKFVVGG